MGGEGFRVLRASLTLVAQGVIRLLGLLTSSGRFALYYVLVCIHQLNELIS